ncbi:MULTISPECIES: helix-turn-helix domain-containing protein [Aerococcus]|uniref:helix-turn-helix domain-containing protein n=1 Tax=Aerococcus TaxID=1375 RepID=UPI0018A702E5|nr:MULTISPECIES: helix-turn-helix transcriptional regulator [Aerococcus]MCY3067591.1 helix-turn-helix domain-containing protein [Aerococcus mictus]MCY3080874.1 helix-turn-helix domain-containing protein [Aerococcus mictus]MDK8485479.1 helix-turn-helix transcriptional regulator [Aerococcus urinae]
MSYYNDELVKKYIAKKIKEKREDKGLSQKELAEIVDLGTTTLYFYETGKRTPNADILFLMANVLDADISEFFPSSLQDKNDHFMSSSNNILQEEFTPYEAYDKRSSVTDESSDDNISEFFNLLNTNNKLQVFYYIQSLYKDQKDSY